MSTRIFGIWSSPVPGPNFFWRRDTDGKCTGRHTFTWLRGIMGGATGQAAFQKGTKITTLDPTLPAGLGFLEVDEFEAQDIPGGFCEITVTLTGYTEEGEFEFDREITYSYNSGLVEKSNLDNPRFLHDVPQLQDRASFTSMFEGFARAEVTSRDENNTPTDVRFIDIATDTVINTITDPTVISWFVHIFEHGRRTYQAKAVEWRKSTANAGGLSNSQIDAMGKRVFNPPGNPEEPSVPEGGSSTEWTWLKSGASDTRNSNSASTEEVWTWGYWPEKEYDLAV